MIFVLIFYVFLYYFIHTGQLPVVLLWYYVISGLLLFSFYGMDKRAAVKSKWRISESFLHFLAVIGGWTGAVPGQKFFRHKTIKKSFRIKFWFMVILNIIILTLYGLLKNEYINY